MMWHYGFCMNTPNLTEWMLAKPEQDSVFQTSIAPWLDGQHVALKELDAARPADITYIFHEHVMRVAAMGRDFARFLGAKENEAEWFYHALRVHDCGKTLLPQDLWDTDGKPSDAVKLQRRQHAPLGAEMIERDLPADHPFTAFAADIARHHHEQMDGGGIMGRRGDELSVWVRMACIVDSFDGMSIKRSHFGGRDISRHSVFKRIAVEKGASQYDAALTAEFGRFLAV